MDHCSSNNRSGTGGSINLRAGMKGSNMKKKAAKPAPVKAKVVTSEYHRKQADRHRAQSRLHEAKADMLDVDEPPKGKGKVTIRSY